MKNGALLPCSMLCVVYALISSGCGGNDPVSPGGGDGTGGDTTRISVGLAATLMTASYTLIEPDTLRINVPVRALCDSTATLVLTEPVSHNVYYRLTGSQLRVSLAIAPVLEAVIGMPGLDPEMAATLALVSQLGLAGTHAVFDAAHTESSLEGEWMLTDLELGFLGLIDTVAKAKEEAMNAVRDEEGNGYISLVFDDGTMEARVNRVFLATAVATSFANPDAYYVTLEPLNDAGVTIQGAVSATGITVVVTLEGDIIFADDAGATHTWKAQPQECPNELFPPWGEPFLEANRRS